MKGVSVVTGIARHSFGASFVRASLEDRSNARLIGIDRIPNPDFTAQANLYNIICDLNPLTFPDGYDAFTKVLADRLSTASQALGDAYIACLIQGAGTYEFGSFLSHDVRRRQRVLGLNLLGTTEVLHAVMTLNEQLNHDNSREFTHVLVGSFQGLHTRPERSLYAASKAYGLDLCSGLSAGTEVSKCIYLAIGPMDTAMLHWNHWTAKANGSNQFFQSVFAGDPSAYKSVFIDCSEDALIAAAEPFFCPT
jgi:NAD(P)-dependent dehydrogenase (short-subunit alcohol dehydrogenase family)